MIKNIFSEADLFQAFISGDTEGVRFTNNQNKKDFEKELNSHELTNKIRFTYDDMFKLFVSGDTDEMRTLSNSREDFDNWLSEYVHKNKL